MSRVVPCLLLVLICLAPARAGGLEAGEREVSLRVSTVDLDLGTYAGQDLGTESQRRYSLSIGWARTRVLEIGLDLSYIQMELVQPLPWVEPTGDGYSYGIFAQTNIPTKGIATPYFGVTLSIVGGDVRELYEWDADLSAGVKIYPGRRFGLLAAVSYNRFVPQDDVPGAEGVRYSLGGLFKF